jgi:hypothetical protein
MGKKVGRPEASAKAVVDVSKMGSTNVPTVKERDALLHFSKYWMWTPSAIGGDAQASRRYALRIASVRRRNTRLSVFPVIPIGNSFQSIISIRCNCSSAVNVAYFCSGLSLASARAAARLSAN